MDTCGICGKKRSFGDKYVKVKDGIACPTCMSIAGIAKKYPNRAQREEFLANLTLDDLDELIYEGEQEQERREKERRANRERKEAEAARIRAEAVERKRAENEAKAAAERLRQLEFDKRNTALQMLDEHSLDVLHEASRRELEQSLNEATRSSIAAISNKNIAMIELANSQMYLQRTIVRQNEEIIRLLRRLVASVEEGRQQG